MKKRAIMISMLLVMALSVTGCSQKTATKDKDTKTEETAKTDDAEETDSDNSTGAVELESSVPEDVKSGLSARMFDDDGLCSMGEEKILWKKIKKGPDLQRGHLPPL